MQLLAKFKKIMYMGLRGTLNSKQYVLFPFDFNVTLRVSGKQNSLFQKYDAHISK